jgi:hypothetical protein
MIGVAIAAGTGLALLGSMLGGGKPKRKTTPAAAELSPDVVEVEESDPDLEAAALAAEPGEFPVKDVETGEVVLVKPDAGDTPAVDDAAAEEEQMAAVDEAFPVEEAAGTDPGGNDIEADIAEAEAVVKPGEAVVISEEGTVGIVPETAVPPVSEEDLNADTLDLLEALLAAEHLANWQDHHKLDVKLWQGSQGLVADGLAGPKTILKIAEQVGVAPIVRYWPKGQWKGGPAHLQLIRDLDALGVNSSRELGQAFAPVQKITTFAEVPR